MHVNECSKDLRGASPCLQNHLRSAESNLVEADEFLVARLSADRVQGSQNERPVHTCTQALQIFVGDPKHLHHHKPVTYRLLIATQGIRYSALTLAATSTESREIGAALRRYTQFDIIEL